MALSTYAVKYRHDYRSLEGTQFRLEILTDGYAGDVIDLTGQSEPCTITWNGNDEIETPLVGSVASIGIYQMEGQDLSELYTSDLQEFYVKLSYYDTSSYQLYWKGFIIQDEYVQSITSDPSPINIKATDGIGSLGDISVDDIIGADENITPFDIIKGVIDQTGLEFDFVDVTDMKRSDVANYATSSVFLQYEFRSENLLKNLNGTDTYHSYKDALETVMRSFNCRLFQADGALYAWNITSLTMSTLGVNYTHTYDYSAATWSHSSLTRDVLNIPSDLRPLGDNMDFVSTDPIWDFRRSYNLSPMNLIYNSFFTLDDTGWTDNGNLSILETNAHKGEKSAYFAVQSNIDDSVFNSASEAAKNTTYRILQTSTDNSSATDTFDHTFEPDTYLNGTFSFYYYAEDDQRIRYSIQRGTGTEYYDPDTGILQTSFIYKDMATTGTDKWIKESINLTIASASASAGSKALTFRIHSPDEFFGGGSGTSTITFDDFSFKIFPKRLLGKDYKLSTTYLNSSVGGLSTALKQKKQSLLFGAQNVVIRNGFFSSVIDLVNNTLGQYTKPNEPSLIVKVDYSPMSLGFGYVPNYLENWCLMQLSAIYSAPPKRYSATLSDRRALGTLPMSMVNIMDIDVSLFTELETIAITKLTVNTRGNTIGFTGLTLDNLPAVSLQPVVSTEFNTHKEGD